MKRQAFADALTALAGAGAGRVAKRGPACAPPDPRPTGSVRPHSPVTTPKIRMATGTLTSPAGDQGALARLQAPSGDGGR